MDNMHQQKMNIIKKMAELRGGSANVRNNQSSSNAVSKNSEQKNNSNNNSRGCNSCSRKKQS
jgi:hypothetical protein